MANHKTTLRLKKSGLRVLNQDEARQVGGGTLWGTVPYTLDPYDCLPSDICPFTVNCSVGCPSVASLPTGDCSPREPEMPY